MSGHVTDGQAPPAAELGLSIPAVSGRGKEVLLGWRFLSAP